MCCPHLSNQIIPVPHIPFYSLTPLTALLGEWPANKARITAQNETCKHGLLEVETRSMLWGIPVLPSKSQNKKQRIYESDEMWHRKANLCSSWCNVLHCCVQMRVKGFTFFTGQLHFFLGVGSSEITCSLKGRQIFSCNAEAGTSKSRRNTKFDISINPRPSMQNFW